jgi:hypothetical protein
MIRDADEIFEKRASKTRETGRDSTKISYSDEDVFKLAEELRRPTKKHEKTAESGDETAVALTLREKLAHSVALVDTLLNLERLEKLAAFESAAREKGFSDQQIQSYFEKNASVSSFRSVLSEMPDIFRK